MSNPSFATATPGLRTIAAAAFLSCFNPAHAADSTTVTTDNTLPDVRVKAQAVRESATGQVQGYKATRAATATKTDTPLNETPQSISVITRDAMDDRGAASVAEVLRYSAGVKPGNFSYGGDVFVMRGFDVGDEGLFLDGLRAFTNVFSSSLETYGAERVEVLRGPASVLYGLATPGGVVNVVSKRPQAGMTQEIGVEVGSHNRKQVMADIGGSLTGDERLLGRLVFLGRDADTQYDWSQDDRLYIAPSLTWRPTASTSLTALLSYNEDRQSYVWGSQYARFGTTAGGAPITGQPIAQLGENFNFSGPGTGFHRKMKTVGYQFEHRFNDAVAIRQNLRWSDIETGRREMWASYFAPNLGLQTDGRTLNRLAVARPDHDRALNVDNHVEGRFATGAVTHTLIGGLDYRRVTFHSEISSDGIIRPLDLFNPTWTEPNWDAMNILASSSTSKGRQTGLYAQDQMKFGPNWAVTAGLRRDRYSLDTTNHLTSTTSGYSTDATTGRLGAVYLASNGWAPYVSYATSFEPNAPQQGKTFDPSSGKQIEAGVRYEPAGQDLSLIASVYDLRKTNVLMTINNVVTQRGEVGSRGLELEANVNPTKSWTLTGAYTYTDSEITRSSSGDQGQRVINIPRVTASVWSMNKLNTFVQGLSAGAGVRYVGESRSSDPNRPNEASTLIDAVVAYETGPWKFSFNADNLFDKTVLTECSTTVCMVSYGRNLKARATYRW
ncbi:MAG TPA: TonB-dependent siderophore receptor [Candidatus Aquabacterium excrementipullorum]|nr:TonB-dependent siderophore receptor [Candidatus Aquabacterium excrementipullorum]